MKNGTTKTEIRQDGDDTEEREEITKITDDFR